MRLRHIGISLAILGFAVSGPAARAQSRDDKFSAWDTNHDGRLEIGEMQANQANFRAMDCNHDGYLSREEFTNRYQCDENNASAAAVPAPVQVPAPQVLDDEFARLDRNRDGVISQGEWTAGADSFRRYDRNNDGRITRDEYANPLDPNSVEGRFQVEDLNNDGVISRGEWRGSRATFDAMDVNRDGVLSLAEYSNVASSNAASWAARFDALDRNRDGALSRWEWRGESVSFGEADRNHDDVVSREEYANLYTSGGNYGGNYGGSYADAREQQFRALDRNNNGEISRGEWRNQGVPFSDVDRNGDNHITRDEFFAVYRSDGSYGGGSANASERRFRELDRNNDGLLTRYEWRNENIDFNTADRNGDRVVTLDEYLAATAGYSVNEPYRRVSYDPRDERFNVEDRNHDGRISRWEWQGDRGAFDVLDANRDGYISNAEYRDRSRLVGVFNSWDSNRDGVLTREEFRYGQPLFDRLDVNRDGVLSRDEFLAM